jgi:RNA polymerase-binding transcription factor DksA
MASLRQLTSRDRRALRTALLEAAIRTDEQIAALTHSFDDIVAAVEMTNNDDEHDPEGTTIAFERAQVSALLDQATSDRAALREATARLDDDAYGVCEHCEGFIGVERLLALPWATRCVGCASA